MSSNPHYILFDYFRINRRFNYSVLNSVIGLAKLIEKIDPRARIQFPNFSLKFVNGVLALAPFKVGTAYQNSYFELNYLQKTTINSIVQDSDFVYLYEGTPAIKEFLNERNVTYIDFRVSAIRYNRELYLDVASNKDDESTLWLLDELRRAQITPKIDDNDHKGLMPKTLVFIGQKEGDVSMLDRYDGQRSWLNYASEINYLVNQYDNFLYRQHPLSTGRDLKLLKTIIGELDVHKSSSVYDLFDGEHGFCALSSSVLAEADSYKLKTHRLMTSYPLIADCDSVKLKNVSIFKLFKRLKIESEENVRDLLGGKWSPAIG